MEQERRTPTLAPRRQVKVCHALARPELEGRSCQFSLDPCSVLGLMKRGRKVQPEWRPQRNQEGWGSRWRCRAGPAPGTSQMRVESMQPMWRRCFLPTEERSGWRFPEHQYWKESTQDGSVIVTSAVYENLWRSCASDSTGTYDCREFPSLFALPGYIQASRALMIASIVFGAFGLAATLVGMQCSKVCGENYILKGRVAAIGGVFFLLQGICTMIAISWYAANITQQFFDQLYAGTKYEIGQALYIGWSSAVLAICGGSCLLFSCRSSVPREKIAYPYQPSSRGHILSTVATSQTAPSNYDRNAYV